MAALIGMMEHALGFAREYRHVQPAIDALVGKFSADTRHAVSLVAGRMSLTDALQQAGVGLGTLAGAARSSQS